MRLSDVMGALQLTAYAEAGLLLFLAAFVAIVVRLLRSGQTSQWQQARYMPLEGSAPHLSPVDTSPPGGSPNSDR